MNQQPSPADLKDIPFELIGGGDSTLHFHTVDRAPTHDTLARLQALDNEVSVAGSYLARYADDILLANGGSEITLPLAIKGKEFEVVMLDSTAPVTVNLTAPDTIYGEGSATLTVKSMALRFKAIPNGWILI